MEEDSFAEYKGELEKELGISGLKPPTKPMNAYMRFFLERSSEERAKGEAGFGQLSASIAAEWNNLPTNRREYYQQMYEIRSRERETLLAQYELLANLRKPLSPYSRFIKKRYLQYSKEYAHLSSLELTKLANEDWRKLSTRDKDRLKQQYEEEKNDLALGIDRADQLAEYNAHLERYHATLEEDKNKILRKFGLSAEHKAQMKLKSRQRRDETKLMIKDVKQNLRNEERRRGRQRSKRREQQEQQRLYQITETQRDQEKEALRNERARLRAQSEASRQKEREQKEQKEEKDKEEREGKAKEEKPAKTKNIAKSKNQLIKTTTGETFVRATRSRK